MPAPQPRPVAPPAIPAGMFAGWIPLLILLLAAGLRLPGLWTDFWLDEIWSWTLVWDWRSNARISGVAGIFTEIHQDNNNYLNTLFLYVCGPAAPTALYRLPALLAGVATVWLGGHLVARWTEVWQASVVESGSTLRVEDSRRGASCHNSAKLAVWFGLGLLATSEVEVIYSSEARGYALAGCAALAAQWSLGRLLRFNNWSSAGGFALLACAGFLSHLSFLPVFLAQAVWSLAALIWSRQLGGSWNSVLGKLLVAFGSPSLMVGGLWLVDLSRTHVGGGPELIPLVVACDTLSMPFGVSLPEAYSFPLGLLFAALLITGLWSLRRAPTLEIVGLAGLTVIAPAVLFGMAPQGLVYPRHFLVSLTLLIPVAGAGLARWLTADRRLLQLPGFLVVTVWCLGNGSELIRFWSSGRGQYQAALAHIAGSEGDRELLVGGDFDFRNAMLVGFYQVRSPAYQRLIYVPQTAWGSHRPDWILMHDLNREPRFLREVEAQGQRYSLDKVFPFAGPVGWHWGAYRLVRTVASITGAT